MRALRLKRISDMLARQPRLPSRELLKTWGIMALPPALCSVVFGLLWLKPRLYLLTYNSLDPSYIYGVEKASELHESFGQQFTSNYGPLGYAVSNFLPEKIIPSMLWHAAAVLAVGFGVYIFCRLYVQGRPTRWLATALLLFALAFAGPEWLYLNIFILYSFIYLKLKPRSVAKRNLLIGLVVVSVLYILTKFTIGMVSIVGLSIIILTEQAGARSALRERIRLLAKVLLGYGAGLIVLAYILGIKNIFAYAISSLEVATGFSGAMAINDPNLALATKYIFGVFALLALWLVLTFNKKFAFYVFLLPALFVVFKYAVTRQDGHVLVLLQVVVFLAVLCYFLQRKIRPRDGVLLGLIIAASLMALWTNYTDFRQLHGFVVGPLTNVREHQALRFLNISGQKKETAKLEQAALQTAVLPESMRRTIGAEPVDVFPWETVIVKANNLGWRHRPSPYSFETYTHRLDAMNADFITDKGPKYIVWHKFGENGALGVDGRHLLWDGPRTIQAVLAHYRFVEADENFMLLARTDAKTPKPQSVALGQARGSDWIPVPQAQGLVCAEVAIDSSLKQIVYKGLIRERPFFVEARYSDGTVRLIRFVKETADSGLIINTLPYDWAHLTQFFRERMATDDKVAALRISNEPSARVTFVPCHE